MWTLLATSALAGTLTAHHATTVEVDGAHEVEAWGEAHWYTLARPWDATEPSTRARVALAWTEAHLCLAADVEDRDLVARLTAHDSMTWHDDVIELFIRRHVDDESYVELHVTPRSTVLDLRLPCNELPFEACAAAHPFHVVAAARVAGTLAEGDIDRGWMAELCVPWSDLGGPPRSEDQWTVLVARYDRGHTGSPELSSTGNLTQADYHRIQEYDRLELAPAQP